MRTKGFVRNATEKCLRKLRETEMAPYVGRTAVEESLYGRCAPCLAPDRQTLVGKRKESPKTLGERQVKERKNK